MAVLDAATAAIAVLDAATAAIAVLDAATAAIAVLLAITAAMAVLDAATAAIAVLDAATAAIAVLDAATAAIAVLLAITAAIVCRPASVALVEPVSVSRPLPTLYPPPKKASRAVYDAATAAMAVLDAATAAIAVLDAATAAIAVLLAAMRRACPRIPSSTLNSASLPGSAFSSVCSCAPVVVPASTAFKRRIARIMGIVCPYDLITVMGHAKRMAELVFAAAALAFVSMTVTVLAALTQA